MSGSAALRTLMSQYAQSPILVGLISAIGAAIDPAAEIDDWHARAWDVDTAEGWGLDVWGRIVNVGRVVAVPVLSERLGFAEGPSGTTFGHGTFSTGPAATANVSLTDQAFRQLILTKALANVTATTVPAMNRVLQLLFAGRGRVFVQDGLDMTLNVAFGFPLLDWELSILQHTAALLHPAGVLVNIEIVGTTGRFGFGEATSSQTFGHGVFFGGFE